MLTYSVWVIDDERSIREGIGMALQNDYGVRSFPEAETALAMLEKEVPDLILLDIGLPGMDGIDALKRIKSLHPDILVIMITAFEAAPTVIEAMKNGAYDYIIKPILMPGLRAAIGNALDNIRLQKEVRHLQERYLKENLPCFIGESRTIQDVMNFIAQVAKSPDTPVLILGETGAGKELAARAIHYRSPNFKGRFVTVNCAAIPRDLIESELFGYEKGAFSGASTAGKKGLIEAAENGTLFLDEIGDLIPEAQAKLLRFLEEGEFYRVGGTRRLRVAARVISATNKDLEAMMKKERFRRDLFFRLSVVRVVIPSLNERKADILPIALHFLNEFNGKFGKSFSGFDDAAVSALKTHDWIGNVRELRNIIERGALVGKGPRLSVGELGLENGKAADTENGGTAFPPLTEAGVDLMELEAEMEKHYFREALDRTGGNEARAARLLGMKPYTFRYRRGKLGI